jgi:hypothetical protein
MLLRANIRSAFGWALIFTAYKTNSRGTARLLNKALFPAIIGIY